MIINKILKTKFIMMDIWYQLKMVKRHIYWQKIAEWSIHNVPYLIQNPTSFVISMLFNLF